MGWNHRVATKVHVYSKELAKVTKRDSDRFFSIVECYYDKKGKPKGYTEPAMLVYADSVKDLKWSARKILGAFKQPVLDLDNWPKKFKSGKTKKKK